MSKMIKILDYQKKKMNIKKINFINMLNNDKTNKQIFNILRESSSRISQLETQLNNIIQKDINNLKKDLKNHDLENQSDFKLIDMKMKQKIYI